jgi:hypothetical protein
MQMATRMLCPAVGYLVRTMPCAEIGSSLHLIVPTRWPSLTATCSKTGCTRQFHGPEIDMTCRFFVRCAHPRDDRTATPRGVVLVSGRLVTHTVSVPCASTGRMTARASASRVLCGWYRVDNRQ